MISPELLRRYPFFGPLTTDQLKQVAMIADEVTIESGETILHEGNPAQNLYLLMEGGVDVLFEIPQEDSNQVKEFFITEINPGEPFGISSMVDPFMVTTSVRTSSACRVIKISAIELRKACDADKQLAAVVFQQIAKSAIERLNSTRVQLVAARS